MEDEIHAAAIDPNGPPSPMQSAMARPGNKSAAFWSRHDVMEAQKLIDLWASQRKHMDEGAEGVIRADKVFEAQERTFEIFENGLRWIYTEYRKCHTGLTVGVKDIPKTMMAMLMVDGVVRQLDLAPERAKGIVSMSEALLLHLYPRTGPYQVESAATHRTFNPPGFVGLLGGKYFDRAKEAFLRQLERDFLGELMMAGRNPSGFFQGHDGLDFVSLFRRTDPVLPLYGSPTADEQAIADALRPEAQ